MAGISRPQVTLQDPEPAGVFWDGGFPDMSCYLGLSPRTTDTG